MNTMTLEKIYLTPNQEKVIKDKYLRGDKSVEELFARVSFNIALSEVLFAGEAEYDKIFDGVNHEIINYDLNGVPSKLILLHKNLYEASKREENFQKFIKNITSVYEKNEKLKKLVDKWAEEFYNMMAKFEFLPNSPTLMNAGRELQQLSACYVIPVEDSMEGISKALSAQSMIQKSGGGTGFSFGRLRPKGDLVKKTNGVASGAISFMQIFDKMTDVVKQGGTRRGANMGILPYWHPEIEEFITLKSKPNVMENFNLSVALDDKFMKAVENGEDIDLLNPRTKQPVSKLNARKLFNKLVESAWATGDPGIVFIDRINNTNSNPTPHIGEIEATNPCITKDSWVTTSKGPKMVGELIGKEVEVLIEGKFYLTAKDGFFKTGVKQVYELITDRGYRIKATEDHLIMTKNGWKKLIQLNENDEIILSNNRNVKWEGKGNFEEGYLVGIIFGKKLAKEDDLLRLMLDKKEVTVAVNTLMKEYALSLSYINKPQVFQMNVEKKSEENEKVKILKELFDNFRLSTSFNSISYKIEETSYDFHRGFLKGLYDSNGHIVVNENKEISIRLLQSNIESIIGAQRMLARMGILSTIGNNKKGDTTENINYELVISNDNLYIFKDIIGFRDKNKQKLLEEKINSHKLLNKESFTARVKEIKKLSEEEVFDVQVPFINCFDANGIIVHNCGEQPLLGWEACNLGSINLSKFVHGNIMKGKIDWESLGNTVTTAVRFLDNVIEINNYPLPEIEQMAKSNRKIGLGVMGWAETCVKLGIRYDSEEGIKKAKEIMKFIQEKAFEASKKLAEERGCFYNWKGSIYDKDSTYFRGQSAYLRNASRTTIAPTGTISIAAGLQGSGIEPFFAIVYTRYTAKALEAIKNGKTPDAKDSFYEVNPLFKTIAEEYNYFGLTKESLWKKIEENHKAIRGIPEIPKKIQDIFPTAHDITYEYHIKTQAAFQEFTDNAVSKTINLPNSAKVEDVRNSYLLSYKLGCKGITVYRDGSKNFQVLNLDTKNDKTAQKKKQIKYGVSSEYYQIQTGYGPLHIHINFTEETGPFQIFTNIPPLGTEISGLTALIGILLSKYLENGGDPVKILKHLNSIKGDKPFGFGENRVNSIPHAISIALRDHLKKRKLLGEENTQGHKLELWDSTKAQYCPKCYSSNISFESGCSGPTCHDCGYSECS
ncbi:MAG: ribonucleoside reductase class II [Elusimicrobiota bacterium]